MSRYENIECPVCKRIFAEGDDIVVCPECGTPHHRECYNYVGHCVNKGLHKTNFDFSDEEKLKKNNFDIVSAFKEASGNNGNSENNAPAAPPLPAFISAFDSDPQTIDGESISDVAATVRSNAPRFVRIFKRLEDGTKKLSWNWGAFFFGSLYYFYRKIYRQAVSLISLTVMLLVGSDFLFAKLAPKTMEVFVSASEFIAQNNTDEAQKLLSGVQSAADYNKAIIITYSFIALFLILRVAEALAADKIYKSTVTSLIKRVRVQLDNGAAFSTPMVNNENVNLSQEQMRRIYLSSKGGVNLFAPMIAFLAVQMLLNLI